MYKCRYIETQIGKMNNKLLNVNVNTLAIRADFDNAFVESVHA